FGYYQEPDGKTYNLYRVPKQQVECGLSDKQHEKKFVTYAFTKEQFKMLDVTNLSSSYIENKSIEVIDAVVDHILKDNFGSESAQEINLDNESIGVINDVEIVDTFEQQVPEIEVEELIYYCAFHESDTV